MHLATMLSTSITSGTPGETYRCEQLGVVCGLALDHVTSVMRTGRTVHSLLYLDFDGGRHVCGSTRRAVCDSNRDAQADSCLPHSCEDGYTP